jgi:tRNA dimethylallyltransferase
MAFDFHQKKVIVIAGPTAVGKTNISITVASQLNAPIISADSRQFYREIKIGSAAPSKDELAKVPHYLIADRSIFEPLNSGSFADEVNQLLPSLFADSNTVIICGGSGLYIDALIEGFDEMPEIDLQIRTDLNLNYQTHGIEWLQQELKQVDLPYYHVVDLANPQRLIRALEVYRSTGKTYSSFRQKKKSKKLNYQVLYFVIDATREQLYERINRRVDQMMAIGLEAEARLVYPHKHINALQTVGYKELFKHFDGEWDLETAIHQIKQNTRRFAKRQLTWFRKKNAIWINADDQTKAIDEIIKQIA